jgi:hypothetical protein
LEFTNPAGLLAVLFADPPNPFRGARFLLRRWRLVSNGDNNCLVRSLLAIGGFLGNRFRLLAFLSYWLILRRFKFYFLLIFYDFRHALSPTRPLNGGAVAG